jgi:hypothetical protein
LGRRYGHWVGIDPKFLRSGLGFSRFLKLAQYRLLFEGQRLNNIDKPSLMVLAWFAVGGCTNRLMCESASVKNCRSGETSIVTFRAKKAGIRYGTKIPMGIPPEFAT